MNNIEQYIIIMSSLLFQFFYTYDTSHKNTKKRKSRPLAYLKKIIYSFQKQEGRGGVGRPCPFLLVPPSLCVGALSVNWVLTGLQRLPLGSPHLVCVQSFPSDHKWAALGPNLSAVVFCLDNPVIVILKILNRSEKENPHTYIHTCVHNSYRDR